MPQTINVEGFGPVTFPDHYTDQQISHEIEGMVGMLRQDIQNRPLPLPKPGDMIQRPNGPVAAPAPQPSVLDKPTQNVNPTVGGMVKDFAQNAPGNLASKVKQFGEAIPTMGKLAMDVAEGPIPWFQDPNNSVGPVLNGMFEKWKAGAPAQYVQGRYGDVLHGKPDMNKVGETFMDDPFGVFMDVSTLAVPAARTAEAGLALGNMPRAAAFAGDVVKGSEMLDPIAAMAAAVHSPQLTFNTPRAAARKALNEEHKLGLTAAQLADPTLRQKALNLLQTTTDEGTAVGRAVAGRALTKTKEAMPRANQAVGDRLFDAVLDEAPDVTKDVRSHFYEPVDEATRGRSIEVPYMEPYRGSMGPQRVPGRGDEAWLRQQGELGQQADLAPQAAFRPSSNEARNADQLGSTSATIPSSLQGPPTQRVRTVTTPPTHVNVSELQSIADDVEKLTSNGLNPLAPEDAQAMAQFAERLRGVPASVPFDVAQRHLTDINRFMARHRKVLGDGANALRARAANILSGGLDEAADVAGVADEFAKAQEYSGRRGQAFNDPNVKNLQRVPSEKIPQRFSNENPTAKDALDNAFKLATEHRPMSGQHQALTDLDALADIQKIIDSSSKANGVKPIFNFGQLATEAMAGGGFAKLFGLDPATVATGVLATDVAGGATSWLSRQKLFQDLLTKAYAPNARRNVWAAERVGQATKD